MGLRTQGDFVLIEFDYTLDFDTIIIARARSCISSVGENKEYCSVNHTNLKSVNIGDSARPKSRSIGK